MISVFNTLPVFGSALSVSFTTVVTRATTAAAETTNESIWITQVSGY